LTRITAVIRNLITLTGSGDWAFWLPFAAMQSALSELNWEGAPTLESVRLLRFIQWGCEVQAARAETFLEALQEKERRPDRVPVYPPWTDAMTAELQARVLEEFPQPTAAPEQEAPRGE